MSTMALSSDPPAEEAPPPSPEQLAVQEVTSQLNAEASGDKRKRKSPGDDDTNDQGISGSYKDYGRAFLRLGDPFTPIDDIIQHGIFIETTEEIDYPKMDKQQRRTFDYLTESWEILWRMIGPSFRDQMIKLAKHRKLRRRVAALITSGLTGSRGEDANTLKKCVPGFLNVDPTVALSPPIPTKILRGFNHAVTARLLCPAKHPPTQETYDAIANAVIVVTGQTFPRFFYPDSWVYEKDPETGMDNLDDQLLEGHLMPRVAKCLLQGPSTALKDAGYHRGTRGNAAKIGARCVTSRLAGYFAFQTLFSISSLESWEQADGKFDYEQFYWTVVGLFDDGDNAHILEAFNHHVFGDIAGRPNLTAPSTEKPAGEEESDFEAYKAMRAAKKAKLAAEAEAEAAVAAATDAAAAATATAAATTAAAVQSEGGSDSGVSSS